MRLYNLSHRVYCSTRLCRLCKQSHSNPLKMLHGVDRRLPVAKIPHLNAHG